MQLPLEEAMQLATQQEINFHKEADKKIIRKGNEKEKDKGEVALYAKLRKAELDEVRKQNRALEKSALEDGINIADIKKYHTQGLVYGVMKIKDYIEMLKSEIAEEDAKSQQ
ncbi:MAG: hypothetical protein J6A89_08720 [Clostridia bacterium]|nr:hypothetical protein [Clostridia bacterium]